MSAIGEIETLIAQGEVRDLLVAQRQGQADPVMEGRVNDFVMSKSSLWVGQRCMTDFAAPAFHERNDQIICRQRTWRGAHRSVGHCLQLLLNKSDGALDFQ